jgi:membrane-associated phospholipid phosphatase
MLTKLFLTQKGESICLFVCVRVCVSRVGCGVIHMAGVVCAAGLTLMLVLLESN